MRDYYAHAKERIPGGVSLISKRPERFCDGWPAYYSKANGCEVWDIDKRHFYDFSYASVGACPLGYADHAVTEAVVYAVQHGNYCNLSPFAELVLADKLCELHSWAERVKFARTGGEAMAIAVRIARATTGRDVVLCNGYHGWHDWYMAANIFSDQTANILWPGVGAEGVPQGLMDTIVVYKDDVDYLEDQLDQDVAAVIFDANSLWDKTDLAREALKLAHDNGALFIMDEVSAGFRHCLGGWHLLYDIQPDIAVFAKALGNGHPIAAVIGTKAAMEGAERTFISSTYWTEATGPTAAIATIQRMAGLHWPEELVRAATGIRNAFQAGIDAAGIQATVAPGPPESCSLVLDKAQTLCYTSKMLARGFLATPGVHPMVAHDNYTIGLFAVAVKAVFAEMVEGE